MKSLHELAQTAQERLGVKLKDSGLLITALTHSSYVQGQGTETGPSNERLEFLGDAVLGLVIADYVFHEFPEYAEGELTRLKAALVCEPTLAQCAREAGLGELILLGLGEEEHGGRDRPSILADAFEAVTGAIFLDQGLAAATEFILRWLEPVATALAEEGVQTNFKGSLQELTQDIAGETPEYVTVKESGPGHDKTFVVRVYFRGEPLGEGTGKTKKAAEQEAAKEAIKALRKAQALSASDEE